MFITGGEHDLTENIVHLVLGRLPDAPRGSRGLSLFLVPKYVRSATGMQRNGVTCDGIEKKMGLTASPTCSMRFDEATGYLIGQAHGGLRAMFVMMNAARLQVAMQGVGHAESAHQRASSLCRRTGANATSVVYRRRRCVRPHLTPSCHPPCSARPSVHCRRRANDRILGG